jgi:hypothetical protein
MRGLIWILAIAALLGGCESAEEKCDAAKAEMREGLRAAADAARERSQAAAQERAAAMEALSTAVMDLGNLRSDAVVTAIGAEEDGAVGVEVSIGAMMASLLATERLAETDPDAADQMAAAARAELDGRYEELMTLDLTGEGAAERLTELGDGCSTDLQNRVRDLPTAVRGAVLARYTALQSEESAPDESTDFERVKTAFNEFEEARAAARAAKEASDTVVAALDALDGPVGDARAAFQALPEGVDLGVAAGAADRAWESCAE